MVRLDLEGSHSYFLIAATGVRMPDGNFDIAISNNAAVIYTLEYLGSLE